MDLERRRFIIREFKQTGNCRNVRGLGKSMVVFRLFEKLKIFK